MKKVLSAEEWISSGQFMTRQNGQNIFFRRGGSGKTIVLVHGFPTWSYDYAELFNEMSHDQDVIAFDFLGYGASDKPKGTNFSVDESANVVEELLSFLDVREAHLVIHDYGAIVGQELLDRLSKHKLTFGLTALSVMNSGIVYETYRPTFLQKLLALPILGKFISSQITPKKVRKGLDAVRGVKKLDNDEFENLSYGIFLNEGSKLAYRHIAYNVERAAHFERWESALVNYSGPLQFIWGLDDPVSGAHTLSAAKQKYLRAQVIELDGIGHFPQSEAPMLVANAIREMEEKSHHGA